MALSNGKSSNLSLGSATWRRTAGSTGRVPVYLFYDGCNEEPIKLIAVLYF